MVSIYGIQFAPFNVPLQRRLQTLAVMHFLSNFFLILPLICILIYSFLTPYYWITLLYFVYVYLFEWNAPQRGGRRINWVRRWKLWHYFRDYFPISLVKTAELNPKYRYLLGYHPHGIIGVGAFCNFATEASGFSTLFPGIAPYLLTLNEVFYFPLLRSYGLFLGIGNVSRESLIWRLTRSGPGTLAVIVIGGAEEALDAHPNSFVLTLKNRKGFIRIALETGAHLIPSYSFGENNLYNQMSNVPGSRIRSFQGKFKSIFGITPPIFYGRGIFNYTFGFMPHRKKVETVVGAPIAVSKISQPTQEEVDDLHNIYVTALSTLFDQHKHKHDISDEVHLQFI